MAALKVTSALCLSLLVMTLLLAPSKSILRQKDLNFKHIKDFTRQCYRTRLIVFKKITRLIACKLPDSFLVANEINKLYLLMISFILTFLLSFAGCGNKEACDEWLSDTYRMLLLCSSKTCNKHCINEGATRGKCGFLIFRSFCFCTKECD